MNTDGIGAVTNSRLALAALAAIFTWNSGLATEDGADIRFGASPGSAGVNYIGDHLRVSVGIDDDGEVQGELFSVFAADENSNWIGELWLSDERGGVKLNYHWLSGASSVDEASASSNDIRVRKGFIAVDQNQFDDRKISIGLGQEGPQWFWGVYGMKSLTDERLVSESIQTEVETLTGFQGNREFVQDQFTDTTTRLFEHPYDYGAGARIGHYYDRHLWRVRGGVDYEKGDFSTDQLTFSLGVEKFFANTGHSLALTAEHLNKSGRFEVDEADTRAMLFYRFSFGEIFRPRRDYVERRVERRTEPRAAVREPRLVANRITISRELLFAFDQSALRQDVKDTLQSLSTEIQSLDIVGSINVTGHTCDLGTDDYNQGLSERRANSVARYMTTLGIPDESMEINSSGEHQPRYPNDSEANREKNRRVEIEFVSIESQAKDFVVNEAVAGSTEVSWERESIDDPAWIERALRNPVAHKRVVDVYRFEESTSSTRLGEVVFINTFPEATDDTAITQQDQSVTINVLANDSDADGDMLTIVALGQPSNGMTLANADGSVVYTPLAGFFGVDAFTYTVADDREAQSTATVTVEVIELPALVANDDSATTVRNASVAISVLTTMRAMPPTLPQ